MTAGDRVLLLLLLDEASSGPAERRERNSQQLVVKSRTVSKGRMQAASGRKPAVEVRGQAWCRGDDTDKRKKDAQVQSNEYHLHFPFRKSLYASPVRGAWALTVSLVRHVSLSPHPISVTVITVDLDPWNLDVYKRTLRMGLQGIGSSTSCQTIYGG